MTNTQLDNPSVEGAAPLTLGAITHVALTVSDLAASVAWYQRLVGSDAVLDENTGPFHHTVFALGGTLLGLHSFPDPVDGPSFDPRRPGLDHVAFTVADRAELVRWGARLDELGVAYSEIVDAHYGSGISFKDPDGLALELFCPPA
jgi:glyoxylase I family protein